MFMVYYQRVAGKVILRNFDEKCERLASSLLTSQFWGCILKGKILAGAARIQKKMPCALQKAWGKNEKNWSFEKYNSELSVGIPERNPEPFGSKKS
jgi:hypothetical protein